MSTEPESSPPPPPPPAAGEDVVRDVVLWRRKKLSIAVLLVATATWVVMEVYEYNFITVASWAAMVVVTSLFLWGSILRLFNKEPPDLSGLQITEESAVEMANKFRSWMERGIQWMFRVGAEGDLLVFAGTVAALWIVSKVGSYFDLLSLLYIGIVMVMTLPAIYVRYEDKIKEYEARFRNQCKRFYSMIDEKVLSKMKNKVAGDRKRKKME